MASGPQTLLIRKAALDLAGLGWKPREIAEALPVHKATVYRVLAEFGDLAELAGGLDVGRGRAADPGEN